MRNEKQAWQRVSAIPHSTFRIPHLFPYRPAGFVAGAGAAGCCGVLPVVTLSLVYKIVPKERIGSAMGMYGVGVLFAPAMGPTLRG